MIEFLTMNAGYVVLTCAMLIWAGIAGYLWRLEIRLNSIERKFSK